MIRRRFIPLAAATALALAVPTGFQQAAHADSDRGYAKGVVVDAATGAPVPFASVDLYRQNPANPADWVEVGGASANRLGQFVVSHRDAGTYKVGAGRAGFKYTIAGGTDDEDATGTPFQLVPGANAAAPTVALAAQDAPTTPPTGTLSGVVVDHTGAPFFGAYVEAYDATTKQYLGGDIADRNGGYLLEYVQWGDTPEESYGVAPGKQVKLVFSADDAQAEWYNDKPTFGAADVVTAGAASATGTALPTVELDRAGIGTITGTVSVPHVAGAAWRAQACIYSVTGENWTCAPTDAAGTYTVDLPAGVYYVKGQGSNATWDAAAARDTGYWPFVGAYVGKKAKKPSFTTAGAKPIVVSAGQTTGKVNITLNRNIKNLVKPWIAGKKLKKGKTLTANPGVWNAQDVDFEIVWKLGKKTLGVGSEYKLTKKTAKKAKKIRIFVTASDAGQAYAELSTSSVYGPLTPGKAKSAPAGSDKPELDFAAKGGKKGKKGGKKK